MKTMKESLVDEIILNARNDRKRLEKVASGLYTGFSNIPSEEGVDEETAIDKIIYWLEKAKTVAENKKQADALGLLVSYYKSGSLKTWDDYNIAWLQATEGNIDYINGFVEVYNDPYMRYDDGRICLFNEVEFNIGEMKAYETTQIGSLAPKIIIEYNVDYNVGDSKLIFVIENENSEAFKQYKSLQRDIKIDNILDGNSL